MAKDAFDFVPQGFRRSAAKGWLQSVPTPERARVKRLEQENADLRGRMDELRAMVEGLVKDKDEG